MEESDCTVAERVEGPLRLEVVRGLPARVQVLLAEQGPLEQEWAQPVEPGPLEQEWAQPVGQGLLGQGRVQPVERVLAPILERVLQELLAERVLSLPIAKQLPFE